MTIAVPTINRTEDAKHSPLAKQKIIGCLLSIVVPIALWFAPLSLGPTASHALAISSFMVIGADGGRGKEELSVAIRA